MVNHFWMLYFKDKILKQWFKVKIWEIRDESLFLKVQE
jgi:hypothetical protein